MSEAARRRMTLEEFDAWQALQDVRCELVDGRPVAMTGATFAHNIVVSNVIRALGNRLDAAGSPCRAFTADIGLVTGPDTLRRPDVTVYCPPFDNRATRSEKATLAVEVGSPSTRTIDAVQKMEEYQRLPALRAVLLMEPERVDVGLWHVRPGGGWDHRPVRDDLAALLDLPCLGISLALAEVYRGVTMVAPKGPRLVWPDGEVD